MLAAVCSLSECIKLVCYPIFALDSAALDFLTDWVKTRAKRNEWVKKKTVLEAALDLLPIWAKKMNDIGERETD